MTTDQYFELQDKLLGLENALQHYGMKNESKEVFSILEDLLYITIKEDTNNAEQRCLDFLAKYKHVRDRFNVECV